MKAALRLALYGSLIANRVANRDRIRDAGENINPETERRPCLECTVPHRTGRSFCSPECCAKFKAKKKAASKSVTD